MNRSSGWSERCWPKVEIWEGGVLYQHWGFQVKPCCIKEAHRFRRENRFLISRCFYRHLWPTISLHLLSRSITLRCFTDDEPLNKIPSPHKSQLPCPTSSANHNLQCDSPLPQEHATSKPSNNHHPYHLPALASQT